MLEKAINPLLTRLSRIETKLDSLLTKPPPREESFILPSTLSHVLKQTDLTVPSSLSDKQNMDPCFSQAKASSTTNSDHVQGTAPALLGQYPNRLTASHPHSLESGVSQVSSFHHAPIVPNLVPKFITSTTSLPFNLNLPPDCAPYVLVLTDVPTLQTNTSESYDDLLTKARRWLDMFTKGPCRPGNDVIMVRRVPWIGSGVKRKAGDCIVVNFNNSISSNFILSNFYAHPDTSRGIIPLPLCYFYQPIIPLLSITQKPSLVQAHKRFISPVDLSDID